MDEDSCLMKYIEIVALGTFGECSNVTDIKQEPFSVKVCVISGFYFILAKAKISRPGPRPEPSRPRPGPLSPRSLCIRPEQKLRYAAQYI